MTDNKIIRPAIRHEEAAVDNETFESVLNFQRSGKTMSVSFTAEINGYAEIISLYRFKDEETGRCNMFIWGSHRGYDEILSIDRFGNKDASIVIKTYGVYSMTVRPVDDIDKHRVDEKIQHILTCLAFLSGMLEKPEDKEMCEAAFDYMKMLHEEYK